LLVAAPDTANAAAVATFSRHCEMFPLLNADKRNPLDLFQIWLNLPRLSKKVPAHFKMLWNEDIPRYSYPGNVVVTPYSGSTALPTPSSPPSIAHPPTPPPDSWANDPSHNVWVWTIKLPPGSTFNVPTTTARVTRSLFFYVGSGLTVSGFGAVDNRTVLEVDASVPVELGNAAASPGDVEVLLLQGQPISEPVAQHGPFVMNSHEEIEQTFEDYHRTGQFGGWEWGSDAPTHGREQGRFARYKDGHTEVPRTIAAKDEV
jgi:redox-sensitive bicupin YhaK (pirin superfamily)